MIVAGTQKQYTPEDLLTMPDGDRYELVNGQLVEQEMSFWACYVSGRLHHRMTSFTDAQQSGWVSPEGGLTFQCFPHDPGMVRKADVSFLKRERWSWEQARQPGHVRLAPDVAVEVMSPNDLAYEVNAKVKDWLSAGVTLVWVIDPEAHMIAVHRANGQGTILREADELDGEDVLPGFRCPLRELFLPPPGVEGTPRS